jgi:WD40 repeat protein/predicted Ser/Thr protein kinase
VNPNSSGRCERCGTERGEAPLGGLCPVCLLDSDHLDDEIRAGAEFHYDLIEEIARGGMGVVYRAVQHGSERRVALKMILIEQAATPGMIERFRAEAEAVAALEHPNILPIYETGEYDGRPFYSMKFADGGSLRERIPDFRHRPREAAQLVALIARAVHHAHQRGILHRDLKPGNILLDGAQQTPFVTDFGLAKWLDRDQALTLLPTALGTPQYMAPEQAAGASAELTTAADTYSLGVILYELLTGRPPYLADSPLEILRLARETAPRSLRDLAPDVPRDLEVICLKCLAKEPAARYASTAALAEDLERSLEGRTIVARPATRAERTWRWAKRNPALAALSGALVLLLVAAAIGSTIVAARLNVSKNRAVAAEEKALQELRAASLAQARATRLGGRMGQRFDTLAALKRAADIRPGADLRTEAFAALMLPDIRVEKTWSDRHASNSPAAFDSTLDRYVVESGAGGLTLRRANDQAEIARLAAPEGNPRALYIAPWSKDDSKVVVRFANDVVRAYETEAGQMLFELTGRPVTTNARAFAYDFGFTPDGTELAVGLPSGGVSFHDARTGRETNRLVAPTVPAALAVSNDGRRVALVAKKSATVEIYDRASGRLEQSLVHPSHLYHLNWRPGVKDQLLASCNDDNLYLWDAATGQKLRVFQGHEGIPPLTAFHPNGKVLASTARDFSVRFWDVENGTPLLNAHVYGEPSLRFSADGRRLALGSEGARLSTATVALDNPCREIFRCDLSDWYSRVSGMSMSRDGRVIAISLRSNGVHLLSAENGALLADLPFWPGESKTAVFTPASDAMIYSGDKSGLWKRALRWKGATLEIGPAELIDPRPDFLITDIQGDPAVAALYGERVGKFSLVPLANPEKKIDLPVGSRPAAAFLTPDTRLVATNDWEGETKGESDVRIWNASTGEIVRRLDSGPNNSVRLSASGNLLAVCGTGPGAGLWRLPDLTPGPKLETVGDDAWFTPDEKMIAVLNNDNLDLIRISDGMLLGSFPGDPTISVCFRPDGKKMFLGSSNHFFEWDLAALRRELRAVNLDWDDPL